MSWHELANCRGLPAEVFFIERGADPRPAKAVCAGCIVQSKCREASIANGERFGIWGGLSERERERIRRAQRAANQYEQQAS